MGVLIHHYHTGYQLPEDNHLIDLLGLVVQKEEQQVGDINVVFTTNEEILELNRKYLDHDYYTDVIAFHYDNGEVVEGDVFISLDKVSENSEAFNATFTDEVVRVAVHGVLHLVGYHDKTSDEKAAMRAREDWYIDYFHRNY